MVRECREEAYGPPAGRIKKRCDATEEQDAESIGKMVSCVRKTDAEVASKQEAFYGQPEEQLAAKYRLSGNKLKTFHSFSEGDWISRFA